MSWNTTQKEVHEWATRNFGVTHAWLPFAGLVEEIGEYSAAITLAEKMDAVGDQTIFVLNLCEKVGLNFQNIADDPRNAPEELEAKVMLGVLGSIAQALLKNEQGIRGFTWEKRRYHCMVGISMWYRWATMQCRLVERNFADVVTEVWDQVRRRDWHKNPTDANLVGLQIAPQEQVDYCLDCGASHPHHCPASQEQSTASQEQSRVFEEPFGGLPNT